MSDPKGEILYRNAWITDWPITEQNVADLAASGRARWKIENENNNTLKTKGFHLEHNFYFPSWAALLRLMMRGLEIGPYAKATCGLGCTRMPRSDSIPSPKAHSVKKNRSCPTTAG